MSRTRFYMSGRDNDFLDDDEDIDIEGVDEDDDDDTPAVTAPASSPASRGKVLRTGAAIVDVTLQHRNGQLSKVGGSDVVSATITFQDGRVLKVTP